MDNLHKQQVQYEWEEYVLGNTTKFMSNYRIINHRS